MSTFQFASPHLVSIFPLGHVVLKKNPGVEFVSLQAEGYVKVGAHTCT